ncbi:hypothetical protein [Streptomyces sp. NPDC088733]|uniref:hypothetical protein n=1 Tax=Streptomyces sp. NPDC088733 TaxID=3365880 RepID=UPI0037FED550
MKSLRTLRLTLPMALATLMLSVAGAVSPASASVTYWRYIDGYENSCLSSSSTTSNVWSEPCGQTIARYQWWWGDTITSGGSTWRQLISAENGKCLTTDHKTDNNAVWTSACGNAPDQWWSGDGDSLASWNGMSLRSSANGDAVYVSGYGAVEFDRYTWRGYRN